MEPVPEQPRNTEERARLNTMLMVGMAAGRAGAWEWDATTLQARGGAVMSRLFGLPPQDCVAGVSLERLLPIIVPGDREEVSEIVQRARVQGGQISIEFRTCPEPDSEYQVLARGRYDLDDNGTVVRGAGIILEMIPRGPEADVEPMARVMYALAEAHDGALAVGFLDAGDRLADGFLFR